MATALATKLHLVVDGMHCEACVRRVNQALIRTGLGPVVAVGIGSAEIEAPLDALPALLAALDKAGYRARLGA